MFVINRLRFTFGGKTQSDELPLLLSDTVAQTNGQGDSTYVTSIHGHQPNKYRSGWRSTVVWQIVLGVSILILNLALTIWCYAALPIEKGVATIYQGQCAKTKDLVTVLHLATCILSSLLLGASNYCMQMLSAPTRKDVDAAHARRKWLNIGVASFKNLLYVDRRNAFVYFLLGISSIPLHLLWNSAFLDTLASNDYVYSAVTESFLEGAPWNNSKVFLPINEYPDEAQAMLNHYTNNSLIRINTTDCINAYNVAFMTEYSNVLLVYNNAANINGVDNNSLLLQGLNDGGVSESSTLTRCARGQWMCGPNSSCALNQIARDNTSHWNPWDFWGLDIGEQERDPNGNLGGHIKIEGFIEYCLAEKPKRPCTLGISPPIIVTVLICNIIKISCFIATLWIGGSMYPLVTNGDVIQSFLLQSDTSFNNRCLASRADVENNEKFWSDRPLPIMWHGRRKVWALGATKGVWLATFIP